MARFGGIDPDTLPRRAPRRKRGTGKIRLPRLKLQNIIIALVVLLILRNYMIKHDAHSAREAGLQQLKEGGLSPEEVKDSFQISMKKLKKDKLSKLVDQEEEKRAEALHDVREQVLKKMDDIHLKKRLEKEAEFEKENPDWVPTRKLRGNTSE